MPVDLGKAVFRDMHAQEDRDQGKECGGEDLEGLGGRRVRCACARLRTGGRPMSMGC